LLRVTFGISTHQLFSDMLLLKIYPILVIRLLCFVLIPVLRWTRRMYWRWASIQDGQAFTSAWWCHCSGTVFPRWLPYFSS